MFDPSAIRAITLDLDDTLWPVMPVIERAEQELQDWLGRHAPRTAALPLERRRVLRREAAQAHAPHAHDLGLLRREAIRACLREAGDDPALAEPAYAWFDHWRQQVRFFDGQLEALARLAERYPLIALSNGTANVFRTAAGPYFRDAVSAREVGVSKPDPRIFAVAIDRTGLRPEQVLHVGDDPGHDVQGARAVGMPVAWYQPHERAWPHDDAPPLRLTHLRELCDRLLA